MIILVAEVDIFIGFDVLTKILAYFRQKGTFSTQTQKNTYNKPIIWCL